MVMVVTPAGAQAPSVATAGLLARVAMDNWARVVPAVTVAMAAHRPAPIPWLAMAAAVVQVNPAALSQPVPVARVVQAVPGGGPRVAHQQQSEHLVVPVVPVVSVVWPLLMVRVPVAMLAEVAQGVMRLPLRL